MGASNQLLAARWNNAMPVSGGPDINNLEACLKLITSIPFATTITVGLGLDEECRFTDPIRSRGTSGPGVTGYRLRDTTSGKEWLIQNANGQLYLYNNTGSEGTPTWEFQGRLPIQCLCHMERSGGASYDSGGTKVTWTSTILRDITSMWASGNPTRIVAPFDGYYRLAAYCNSNAATTYNGWGVNGFYKNGVYQDATQRNLYWNVGPAEPQPSLFNTSYMALDQDDYIEWEIAMGTTVTMADHHIIMERLR